MFLIVWDQLFGTFQRELPDAAYQPKKYGLTTPLVQKTPVTIIFHEWQSIWKDVTRNDIRWKDRWKYIFGSPGWSHDGSRMTSAELRQLENDGSLEQAEETAPA